MDTAVEQWAQKLRRNPQDTGAFAALRAHYQKTQDYVSLSGLLEDWASRLPNGAAAATTLCEAADITVNHFRDLPRGISLYLKAIERDPGCNDAWERLQELYESSGDYRALLDLLQKRIQVHGQGDARELAYLNHELGKLWQHRFQRVDRAVFHYRKAFELDPTLLPAIYAAREIYKAAGNLKVAASLYDAEAAAETDPARCIALMREVASLRAERLGDLGTAITTLTRALELAPQDLALMHDLSTLLLRRAERSTQETEASEDRYRAADLLHQMAQSVPHEHALRYCQAALDAGPAHEGALELLEQLAAELERPDILPVRWVNFLQANPDAAGAEPRRRALGRAYMEAGQWEDAILCFEPLLQREDIEAAEILADAYTKAGRPLDAAQALALLSAQGSTEDQLSRLRELAELWSAEGNADEVVRWNLEILARDPADSAALLACEKYFEEREDYTTLCSTLANVAQSENVDLSVRKRLWQRIADVATEQLNDTDGAISALYSLHALDPMDEGPRQQLRTFLEERQLWEPLIEFLEREILIVTDPIDKARLHLHLARVCRDQIGNLHRAAENLRAVRELEPDAREARAELCDVLLEAGEFQEAACVLGERIADEEVVAERANLRRLLAKVCEEHLGDLEGAFEASTEILDDAPGDLEALDRMDRIDTQLERYNRLLDTLAYRVEVIPASERAPLYARMGQIADDRLGDPQRAIECYRQSFEINPSNADLVDALCRLYDRTTQYRELVALLKQRANFEKDPARRADVYRVIARTLAERVRNEDGAAEAWREVLVAGEDQEALQYLRFIAEKQDDAETLADALGRLAKFATTEEEQDDLLLSRSILLADRLDRTDDAAELLEEISARESSSRLRALETLALLYERTGNHKALASTLERELSAIDDAYMRVPVAERLAHLYEHDLKDDSGAISALYWLTEADPTEMSAWTWLSTLLERTERWSDLATALEKRIELVGEAADTDLLLRSAEVASDRCEDHERAWNRLAAFASRNDARIEEQLVELAHRGQLEEQLAQLYVQLAQQTNDSALRRRRWVQASEMYEKDLEDFPHALEAALHALAVDMDDHELLSTVDRIAQAAEAWPRLHQVYDTLVQRAPADEQVRLWVRHAALLENEAEDFSGAFDRITQSLLLEPLNEELLALSERNARKADRLRDFLSILEHRIVSLQTPSERLDTLFQAMEIAALEVEDWEVAVRYLVTATTIAATEESLCTKVDEAAKHLDEQLSQNGANAAQYALVDAYISLCEAKERPLDQRTIALMRASDLLVSDLDEPLRAFELIKEATIDAPSNVEALDALERVGRKIDLLSDTEAHLAVLADDALDSKTAAELLRRRARLLDEELGRASDAADVYARILMLQRDDEDMRARLQSCLLKAKRYQDLLGVYARELERLEGNDEKVRLMKNMAGIWEDSLQNPWEAADLWKKILLLAPNDTDAQEALERMGQGRIRTAELMVDFSADGQRDDDTALRDPKAMGPIPSLREEATNPGAKL